jgi:thiamine biosynthesis lipoprotein
VTGLPADTPWRTVSVAAASCLDAQIAATATMVRGLDWLVPTGLPARLVGADGTVRAVGGWPE